MIINSYLWGLVFCSYCALINGYINVRLEDKLCAAGVEGSKITLLDDSDSAAIFTQQWNSSSFSNKIRFHCEFGVLSNRDSYRIPRGTYTVISHIKFRKIPNTNECLDYIQFRNEDDSTSERICGQNFADGPTNHLILDHRFRDINVIIHIDSSSKIKEPLELRMVFTAHSQCTHSEDFLCEPKLPYSCISRHFVRDNVTNCMPPCRDESFCLLETAETFTKSTAANEDKIHKKESRDEKYVDIRIADDSTSCITVKLLEEKLKENAQVLRSYIKENEASLLSQISDRINEKEIEPPNNVFEELPEEDNCITGESLEVKLKENNKILIGAMKESENRLSSKIDGMMVKYQQDLFKMAEKVEQLSRSQQSPPRIGV